MTNDGVDFERNPENLSEQSLILQIQALGQLPSPSDTALKLFSLLNSNDAGLKEIAAVVKSNLTLTIRLLRLANRPGTGAVRPVANVEEALLRLGLKVAVHLATGLSVLDDALAHQRAEVSAYLILCRCSLAAAVASEWLTDHPGIPAAAPEMFTTALLSRVGQLALLRFYPEAYGPMVEAVRESGALIALERQSFGVDHVAVGQALLRDWGFPEILADVIQESELHPERAHQHDRKSIMAQVLRFSWEMAPALERGDLPLLQQRLRTALAALGLDQPLANLEEQAQFLYRQWQVWEKDQLPARPTAVETTAPSEMTADPAREPLTILLCHPRALYPEGSLEALGAAGFEVVTCTTLEEAARPAALNQVSMLVAWMDGVSLSIQNQGLFSVLNDRAHALLVLSDQQDQTLQADWMAMGVDAILPLNTGSALLCAQIVRIAERVRLHQVLERERTAHRQVLSQLVVTARKLHHQSLTDPLTELSNRRMAEVFLKRHWAQSERRRTPLSCMIIDMDHFKLINDHHGHDAGDRVLQTFAELLNNQCRQEDLAVRFGGDEFLLICPLTPLAELEFVPKRLLAAASQLALDTGPLQFSFGLAERDFATMRAPEDLLLLADQRLLAAKQRR